MSSFSTAWAVDLDTVPSRFHRHLILVAHLLAGLALLQAGGLAWPWRVLLALAVALVAVPGWRAAGRARWRLREVGEEWWLDSGARQGMVRLRRARVWRWLVVMEFRGEWQGRSWRERVVVWPDAVAPDDFRRLRVRLRCAPQAPREGATRRRAGAPAAPAAGPAGTPSAPARLSRRAGPA
ncbi:MAG TPA: protein YgfX [Moraxellaceae bacterium]|nr:protein YgfX [Moraxellaceae bacterium]